MGCNIKRIWRVSKGRVYIVDLRCGGEDLVYHQRQRLTLSRDKQTLRLKVLWTGRQHREQGRNPED
jgi:hypothetical protein